MKGLKMRISQNYIDAIKKYTYIVFGDATEVFLFGSRVDDSRKERKKCE